MLGNCDARTACLLRESDPVLLSRRVTEVYEQDTRATSTSSKCPGESAVLSWRVTRTYVAPAESVKLVADSYERRGTGRAGMADMVANRTNNPQAGPNCKDGDTNGNWKRAVTHPYITTTNATPPSDDRRTATTQPHTTGNTTNTTYTLVVTHTYTYLRADNPLTHMRREKCASADNPPNPYTHHHSTTP